MPKAVLVVLVAGITSLACATSVNYSGNLWTYIVFTILANGLLLSGCRRKALFFDTFIGVFLWLGFWLKFSIRVVFYSGIFHEQARSFDNSGDAFDRALIVSSVGFAGVLVASLARARFFFYPAPCAQLRSSELVNVYRKHRIAVVAAFILCVILVSLSNAWLGIYQRGFIAQTHLPFGLNGVYKWLLQFGFASLGAVIVRLEIEVSRGLSGSVIMVAIVETFLSNISMLSRGMILNFSALSLGAYRMMVGLKLHFRSILVITTFATFVAAFAVSVPAVNYLRIYCGKLQNPKDPNSVSTLSDSNNKSVTSSVRNMTAPLFVDRWVGIEGVIAVSSYKGLGWCLWRTAWQEKFQEGALSLYDRKFIISPYQNKSTTHPLNHYVSLPGIVAFLFYPGSMLFLFCAMLVCSLAAACLEITTYYLCCRNLVLCAVISQAAAFRFASLGYVPNQSYLFFGALLLNVLIIGYLLHCIRPRNAAGY